MAPPLRGAKGVSSRHKMPSTRGGRKGVRVIGVTRPRRRRSCGQSVFTPHAFRKAGRPAHAPCPSARGLARPTRARRPRQGGRAPARRRRRRSRRTRARLGQGEARSASPRVCVGCGETASFSLAGHLSSSRGRKGGNETEQISHRYLGDNRCEILHLRASVTSYPPGTTPPRGSHKQIACLLTRSMLPAHRWDHIEGGRFCHHDAQCTRYRAPASDPTSTAGIGLPAV